ncbi:hypothetical protein CEUSTIGMA_g8108.t1 [Chlamydomonas eustigma]|uniref:Uncharacterized protein n=1 Tax=Chlamydomonas eustigma TaxID=1157962 RepID=A0A250XC68_9CHLO|nr:hypothetical protein CEUSTIGMA_g8108.t1 [Chlamydomonas eustigma]|eukprot:GAX80673.1 hypothetical protein CEUSTIGMA_g8108.t1 [Chlamydomonas eustigma]
MSSIDEGEKRVFGGHEEAYALARSSILGLWCRNPCTFLTLDACEAELSALTPCVSKGVGSAAYTYLLRHGIINFGSVQQTTDSLLGSTDEGPATTALLIGTGGTTDGSDDPAAACMTSVAAALVSSEHTVPPAALTTDIHCVIKKASDLKDKLYTILRTVDFQVMTEKMIRKQLAEEVGCDVECFKAYIRKHVMHVIDNMEAREKLEPLEDDDEEDQQADVGSHIGTKGVVMSRRVLVVGAGAAGLAAASTLKKVGGKFLEVTVLEASQRIGGRAASPLVALSASIASAELQDGAAAGAVVQALNKPMMSPELLLLPSRLSRKHSQGCSAYDVPGLIEVLAEQQGLDLVPIVRQFPDESGPVNTSTVQHELPELLKGIRSAGPPRLLCGAVDVAADVAEEAEKLLEEMVAQVQHWVQDPGSSKSTSQKSSALPPGFNCNNLSCALEAALHIVVTSSAMRHNKAANPDAEQATGVTAGSSLDSIQPEDSSQPTTNFNTTPAPAVLDVLRWHLRCWELAAGAPLTRLPAACISGFLHRLQASSCGHTSTAPSSSALLLSSSSAAAAVLVKKRDPVGTRHDASSDAQSHGVPLAAAGPITSDVADVADDVVDDVLGTQFPVSSSLLLEGLVEGLDVRYGCQVKKVTYNKKGVKVVTTSGEEIAGDVVLMAVPLSSLQDDDIIFSPELPAWKTGAISRMGCGFGASVLLQYDTAFWRLGAEGGDLNGGVGQKTGVNSGSYGLIRSSIESLHAMSEIPAESKEALRKVEEERFAPIMKVEGNGSAEQVESIGGSEKVEGKGKLAKKVESIGGSEKVEGKGKLAKKVESIGGSEKVEGKGKTEKVEGNGGAEKVEGNGGAEKVEGNGAEKVEATVMVGGLVEQPVEVCLGNHDTQAEDDAAKTEETAHLTTVAVALKDQARETGSSDIAAPRGNAGAAAGAGAGAGAAAAAGAAESGYPAAPSLSAAEVRPVLITEVGQGRVPGACLLVQFAGGGDAASWMAFSSKLLQAAAIEAVHSAFPPPATCTTSHHQSSCSAALPDVNPTPRAVHVSRWGPAGPAGRSESFTFQLASSGISNGLTADTVLDLLHDLSALSLPVKDRLCFAGEYASGGQFLAPLGGRLSASLQSGVREAARILAAIFGDEDPVTGVTPPSAARLSAPITLKPVGDERDFDFKSLEKHEEDRQNRIRIGEGDDEEEEDEDGLAEEEEEEQRPKKKKRGKRSSTNDVNDEDYGTVKKNGRGKRKAKVRDSSDDAEDEAAGDEGVSLAKKKSKKQKVEGGEGKRKRAGDASVAAMDGPGGLGEYDPRRAEAELVRRQEARQDIKAAHKALIMASKGNLSPLWEVLSAASDGWDLRAQLVHVLVQAVPEALETISADSAILKMLSEWIKDCCSQAAGIGIEPFITAMLKLMAKIPVKLEILRGSGLVATVKSKMVDGSGRVITKEVRKAAEELLLRWGPASKPTAATAAAAARPGAAAASRAAIMRNHGSFQAAVHGNPGTAWQPGSALANKSAGIRSLGKQPAVTTALEQVELPQQVQSKIAAAQAAIDAMKEEETRAATERTRQVMLSARQVVLPKIATFEEFKKIEHKARKSGEAGPPLNSASAFDSKPLQSDPKHSHEKRVSTGPADISLLENYVKAHLKPQIECKAITKEIYSKIKDKVIKKLVDAHAGVNIDKAFFSEERKMKIKGMVMEYVRKYVEHQR